MVEVKKVSDRVMAAVLSLEEDVLRLMCGHVPQCRSSLKKQSFYEELECEWDMHSAGDLVACIGDINGHIGRHIDGLDGIHRWYGVGQRNL